MKTLLLLFSLAAATALSAGHIQEAIVSNRTSKKAVVQPANASYECQKVTKKFADTGKDSSKLAEQKVLLKLLCRKASNEIECKAFVSKLGLFIDKLLPYIRSTASERVVEHR